MDASLANPQFSYRWRRRESQGRRTATRPGGIAALWGATLARYRWSKETAQLLRAGNLAAVDMDALIDEYLEDAFEAKLRLDFVNTGEHGADMAATAALTQLNTLFWAAPSAREALTDEVIEEAYREVRRRMAAATGAGYQRSVRSPGNAFWKRSEFAESR